MSAAATDNFKYFTGALGIHLALGALLLVAGLFHRQPIQPQLSLKAVMVDRATLAQMMKQVQPAPPAPEPAPVEPAKPPEPDPAELQREQAAKEAERLKEQQAKEQLQAKQLAQQQAQLQAQAEREKAQAQALAQAKQAEADKLRQQQAQAAEAKRIADIQQKQREVELKRQADAEAKAQKTREAELSAQLASEEGRNSAVNAGLLNQYVAMIQQKVNRYWIKPPTARAGLECEVKVTQAMGGTVLSVTLGRCNGDQAVRASIEAAVNAASPLPAPPDARLFDRNLAFIFKPTD